jgi:methylmalonyl-CoA/ethylmalonyl-CoA epimerase
VTHSQHPTPEPDPSRTPDSDRTGADDAIGSGIGLRRIDHVGLAVRDLDEAIEMHERVFGMRCVHVEENAEQGVREAMLAIGPDGSGGCIQLLAPLSPTSTIARFLDRSGPGVQQVAYTVDDIDRACAALRDRGVRLLYDEPRTGTAGSRINFVHPKDTGGVLVELVEPAESH